MEMLSRTVLTAQDDLGLLGRYLDEAQIIELQSIAEDVRELSNLFLEIDSVEELGDLIHRNLPKMRVLQVRIAQLLWRLVTPEHNDYTRLIDFLTAIMTEVHGTSQNTEFIEFHKTQLDEAHFQRIDIAMQEFSYYEHWVMREVSRAVKHSDLSNPLWQYLERDAMLSQYFFVSIIHIMESPDYKPSLPILIDAFYEAMANINFVIDERSTQSDLIVRPIQNLETLGYGKGRFEGENNEDAERYISIIRELRHQE
jgi:hypothetical protein